MRRALMGAVVVLAAVAAAACSSEPVDPDRPRTSSVLDAVDAQNAAEQDRLNDLAVELGRSLAELGDEPIDTSLIRAAEQTVCDPALSADDALRRLGITVGLSDLSEAGRISVYVTVGLASCPEVLRNRN